jgi:hypothetical protein
VPIHAVGRGTEEGEEALQLPEGVADGEHVQVASAGDGSAGHDPAERGKGGGRGKVGEERQIQSATVTGPIGVMGVDGEGGHARIGGKRLDAHRAREPMGPFLWNVG